MSLLFPRDHDLDLSLESEARVTAIAVAIGVGVFIFSSILVAYLRPVWRTMRQTISQRKRTKEADHPLEPFEPLMASTPAIKLNLRPTSPYHPGIGGPPPRLPQPQQKPPTFFTGSASLHSRRHQTVSHRPTALYNGLQGFSLLQTPPRPRPSFFPPVIPDHGQALVAPPSEGYVTPHIAGWMKVADEVVGRHPHALILRNRVATDEEIALISGHLHIPWAFNDVPRPLPVAIKIQRPSPVLPPHPYLPKAAPPNATVSRWQSGIRRPAIGFLKDVGNIRGGHDVPTSPAAVSTPTFASEGGSKPQRPVVYPRRKPMSKGKENVKPRGQGGQVTASTKRVNGEPIARF